MLPSCSSEFLLITCIRLIACLAISRSRPRLSSPGGHGSWRSQRGNHGKPSDEIAPRTIPWLFPPNPESCSFKLHLIPVAMRDLGRNRDQALFTRSKPLRLQTLSRTKSCRYFVSFATQSITALPPCQEKSLTIATNM